MLHIDECIWDDENVNHLWEAHQVTPDDVEELLFDVDGEEASYVVHRDGDNYVIFGKTGGGRRLTIVGELIERKIRIFAARDMTEREARTYRKG